MAEWNGEWELNGMIEVGNSFEEKQAENYVKRFGLDSAIEKVANVSMHNERAKPCLSILLTWREAINAQMRKNSFVGTEEETPFMPATRPHIQKRELDEKELFSKIVDQLHLSYKDVQVDNNWSPVVPIEYRYGRATVDGKRVWVVRESMDYMKEHVFGKKEVVVDANILKVEDDRVLVKIDEERSGARERKDNKPVEVIGRVSIRNGFVSVSIDGEKRRVMVPRTPVDYVAQLQGQEGQWKFNARVHEDKIVVIPVEKLEEKEQVIKASVSLHPRKGRFPLVSINANGVNKRIYVPSRFLPEVGSKPGIWLFKKDEEKEDKIIAIPKLYLGEETAVVRSFPFVDEHHDPEERRPMDIFPDASYAGLNHFEEEKLSTLLSTGKIEL